MSVVEEGGLPGGELQKRVAICRLGINKIVDDPTGQNYQRTIFTVGFSKQESFEYIGVYPKFDPTSPHGVGLEFVSSFPDPASQSEALRDLLDIVTIERVMCEGELNTVAFEGIAEAAMGMRPLFEEAANMPLACMTFADDLAQEIAMYRLAGISSEFAVRTMEDVAWSIITRNN